MDRLQPLALSAGSEGNWVKYEKRCIAHAYFATLHIDIDRGRKQVSHLSSLALWKHLLGAVNGHGLPDSLPSAETLSLLRHFQLLRGRMT